MAVPRIPERSVLDRAKEFSQQATGSFAGQRPITEERGPTAGGAIGAGMGGAAVGSAIGGTLLGLSATGVGAVAGIAAYLLD